MPPANDQLTPTPFEPAPPRESRPHRPDHPAPTRRWVLPALLGLVALALAVLFWLPGQLAPPGEGGTGPGRIAVDGAVTAGDALPERAPAGASKDQSAAAQDSTPWADAQQAQLRKAAQDVLAQLLPLQEELENRAVSQWAPDAFAAATADAAAGDNLYKQRDYTAARERYTASLAALQALQESIPTRLAQQFEQARGALEAGEAEAAGEHLTLAAQLAPDSPELAALQARLEQLPALLKAMAEAGSAEAEGDLADAVTLLEEATRLDPAHQRAAAELTRVRERHSAARFNAAMSEGYAALDAADFDAAAAAFKRAAALRPDTGEVRSATEELEVSRTAHRLDTLRRSGARLEADEDWQAAVQRYREALAIDPSVVFAQKGIERARPRAELQEQLQAIIGEPERLAEPAVAEAAARLIERAHQFSPAGPELRRQIGRLEQLLAVANTPITVTLLSDEQTAVTVYRVARLGQFSERELNLRPGTYTAVGTRSGYRDVRREFKVSPDAPPEPVVIACTERI